MEDFFEYADYGRVEKLDSLGFRIYKDRFNNYHMSIPYGFGQIAHILWQGSRLHVHTDQGVLFIFNNFWDYERI
jgi:hypothetical protein